MDGPLLDSLADIWVVADPEERPRIEETILAVNRDLEEDAARIGESREGNLRVMFRGNLTFWFSVTPGSRRIRILEVHKVRPRKS